MDEAAVLEDVFLPVLVVASLSVAWIDFWSAFCCDSDLTLEPTDTAAFLTIDLILA